MVDINGRGISFHIDSNLKDLLDGFKYVVSEKNTSVVILCDGRSGMGKTTLMNQVGIYCDNNYDLKNIYYDPDLFLEGLSNAKRGEFLLFDEAMLISNRSTMSRINKMIIQAMSMIRSKNIIVGFCINSIFDMDRNLVLSRADLLLHVYGENLIDRGNYIAFFRAVKQEDKIKLLYLLGKKYYSYAKPKANFVGKFFNKFIVDTQEYERQKQDAINKFLKDDEREVFTKRGKALLKLLVYNKEELSIPIETIVKVTEVPDSTLYRWLKMAKMPSFHSQ